MARSTATKTIQLPPTAEFLKTLNQTTEQCISLLGVKTQTVKIPTNIRNYMRTLSKLHDFWDANRSVYTALVEAAAVGNGKAQRAGA